MKVAHAMSALLAAGLLAVIASAAADDKSGAKSASSPAFEAIKKLAGDWVAVKDGKPTDEIVTRYKVTAGGSAVLEIMFPGGDNEMVTTYTQEGPDVILTHYCMLGNQPRLKCEQSSDGSKLVFKCVGGGNLDRTKDSHMGAATFNIISPDEVKSEWTHFENGKSGEPHKFHIVRKK